MEELRLPEVDQAQSDCRTPEELRQTSNLTSKETLAKISCRRRSTAKRTSIFPDTGHRQQEGHKNRTSLTKTRMPQFAQFRCGTETLHRRLVRSRASQRPPSGFARLGPDAPDMAHESGRCGENSLDFQERMEIMHFAWSA